MLLQILSLGFNIEMKPGTESGFFYFPNYFIAYYFEDDIILWSYPFDDHMEWISARCFTGKVVC